MKRLILIGTILLTLLATAPASAKASVSVGIGLSYFHEALSPYGEWVVVGDYGPVWRPRHVTVGWQPYLNGKWCYTDYGWTWVSFDPWGGDPYHYGTWAFTSGWGWVWVPGTVWAPAWVTWCDTGSYIGWAPVPPTVNISLSGYAGPAVVAPPQNYVFVPTRSLVDVDVRTVRVAPERNAAFVSDGRRITSFAVSENVVRTGGPPVSRIQKAMGAPVRTVNLSVAKTSPAPIARPAGGAKSLPVVMPKSERTPGKGPAVARVEPKPRPDLRGHSRPEAKSEPSVRHARPPHETKDQPQVRRETPPKEVKAQPKGRRETPPKETKAQSQAWRGQPHQVAKAQPQPRQERPPHESAGQPAPRRPEPQHVSKAQPPPEKPRKHEAPEKNGG